MKSKKALVSLLLLVVACQAAPPTAGDHGLGLWTSNPSNGRQLTTENNSGSNLGYFNLVNGLTVEWWMSNEALEREEGETFFRLRTIGGTDQFSVWARDTPTTTMRLYTENGFDSPIPNMKPITDPSTSNHVAFVLTLGGGNELQVTSLLNGVVIDEDRSLGTWAPPDDLVIELFEANFEARNYGTDNLRVWRSARSEEEIRSLMYRVVEDKDEFPDLELDFRFDEGIGNFYENSGHDSLSLGRLEHNNCCGNYDDYQLELRPGFALPSFPAVTTDGAFGSLFDLELKGSDIDGDTVVFWFASVPDGVSVSANGTSDAMVTVTLENSFDDGDELVFVYFVEADEDLSLKTEAYVYVVNEVASTDEDDGGSVLVPVLIAVLLTGGVVGVGIVAVRQGKMQGLLASFNALGGDSKSSSSGTASKKRNKKAGTVGAAIDRLVAQFSVAELNVHCENLIIRGEAEAALALALRVEEEAVDAPIKDYQKALENVQVAMEACGNNDGLEEVKTARRKTSQLTTQMVKGGQLKGKAVSRVRKDVQASYTRKISRARAGSRSRAGSKSRPKRAKSPDKKRGGRGTSPEKTRRGTSPSKKRRGTSPAKKRTDSPVRRKNALETVDWEIETVAASIKQPLKSSPISDWTDVEGADTVTLTDSMAPLI